MTQRRRSETKMVPAPSHGIIPERDLYQTPVLEARHLGIDFGGLKAVEDFNLINSRTGRAIMACRDNRIAAESVGINVTKYKMIAFVISAALAGMAGALYGLNFSTIQAVKFKFDTSILVLVFVVLGGIGSIRGSIIAATVLTVLPEMLREFGTYRMLVYAIVLIVVMLATNNPALSSLVRRATGVFKKNKASDTKGGDAA